MEIHVLFNLVNTSEINSKIAHLISAVVKAFFSRPRRGQGFYNNASRQHFLPMPRGQGQDISSKAKARPRHFSQGQGEAKAFLPRPRRGQGISFKAKARVRHFFLDHGKRHVIAFLRASYPIHFSLAKACFD